MFFFNLSQTAFVEGPGADLFCKIELWYHFRFQILVWALVSVIFNTKTMKKVSKMIGGPIYLPPSLV